MMIQARIAQAARKALSLNHDGVFRLLLVMTILLGWVLSLGTGTVLGLDTVYQKWQLDRQNTLSVYLLADTAAEEVEGLTSALVKHGVSFVEPMDATEVKTLLEPYFKDDQAFLLPIVLSVGLDGQSAEEVRDLVYSIVPTAEVDDNRSLLYLAGQVVWAVQLGVIILGLIVMSIMALLVALTVRVGLRAQASSVRVLQFLGGTDGFLSRLVVHQIFTRTLFGWGVACVAALVVVGIAYALFPHLQQFMLPSVWVGMVLVPLLIPLVALLTSMLAVKNVLNRERR